MQTIAPDFANSSLTHVPDIVKPEDVTSLTLSHNKIRKLPNMEIFKNLTRLSLNDNDLENLCESITRVKRLKWMDLTKNRLENLPSGIENMSLVGLGLSENRFTKIPSCVLKLKTLKKFGFFNNLLKFFPAELCKMSEITKLDLSSNKLETIPESITRLTNLTWLNLSNNNIRGLPDLSKLTKLQELGLSNNRIENLPFMKLESVKILPIYKNSIKCINLNLPKVQKLDLSDNKIDSCHLYIPSCTYLTLKGNRLEKFYICAPTLEILDVRENLLPFIDYKFIQTSKCMQIRASNNLFSESRQDLAKDSAAPEYKSLKQKLLDRVMRNNKIDPNVFNSNNISFENIIKSQKIIGDEKKLKNTLNLTKLIISEKFRLKFNFNLLCGSTLASIQAEKKLLDFLNIVDRPYFQLSKTHKISIISPKIYKYLFFEVLNLAHKDLSDNNLKMFLKSVLKEKGFEIEDISKAKTTINICDSCNVLFTGSGFDFFIYNRIEDCMMRICKKLCDKRCGFKHKPNYNASSIFRNKTKQLNN